MEQVNVSSTAPASQGFNWKDFISLIGGLIMLVVGNIGWRIWCELVIVFFRINKTLSNIEQQKGI